MHIALLRGNHIVKSKVFTNLLAGRVDHFKNSKSVQSNLIRRLQVQFIKWCLRSTLRSSMISFHHFTQFYNDVRWCIKILVRNWYEIAFIWTWSVYSLSYEKNTYSMFLMEHFKMELLFGKNRLFGLNKNSFSFLNTFNSYSLFLCIYPPNVYPNSTQTQITKDDTSV